MKMSVKEWSVGLYSSKVGRPNESDRLGAALRFATLREPGAHVLAGCGGV
jgi:hypothetical protein